MPIKYKEINCKRVLDSFRILDTRLWTRHCFDPYNNCEFNCVYCNLGTQKHKESQDSSVPVHVKINAPQILAKELTMLKRKGVVSLGVATDPYQPAEKKYHITRQILETLNKHNCPFAIGTKSDLILQDLNLISEASKKSWCCISLSITTLDENLAKLLEPNAPSPKRRLETVRRLTEKGITTGIWLVPTLPYVTDSNENIAPVIEAAVESGAKFVLGGTLDMRNQVGFKKFLEEHFPQLAPKYKRLYKKMDTSCMYYPDESYLYDLYKRFISLCQKYGVERYIPHFHTRRQAWLFYTRNLSLFNETPIFGLTQLLNYLSPSRELLQTLRIRSDSSLSNGILKVLHYFPH